MLIELHLVSEETSLVAYIPLDFLNRD